MSFRKAVGSPFFVLNGAETAKLSGYQLDPYPAKWICRAKLAHQPCLSSCLLACLRVTLEGLSALDMLASENSQSGVQQLPLPSGAFVPSSLSVSFSHTSLSFTHCRRRHRKLNQPFSQRSGKATSHVTVVRNIASQKNEVWRQRGQAGESLAKVTWALRVRVRLENRLVAASLVVQTWVRQATSRAENYHRAQFFLALIML